MFLRSVTAVKSTLIKSRCGSDIPPAIPDDRSVIELREESCACSGRSESKEIDRLTHAPKEHHTAMRVVTLSPAARFGRLKSGVRYITCLTSPAGASRPHPSGSFRRLADPVAATTTSCEPLASIQYSSESLEHYIGRVSRAGKSAGRLPDPAHDTPGSSSPSSSLTSPSVLTTTGNSSIVALSTPAMKERDCGRLIQVSSRNAIWPHAHLPTYGAAKAAQDKGVTTLSLASGILSRTSSIRPSVSLGSLWMLQPRLASLPAR